MQTDFTTAGIRYLHTFDSVNRYWFDRPRDLPIIILHDQINACNRLLDGHVNHHIDFLGLLIVQHGRGRHIIDGRPYEVARGDVFTMGANSWHQYVQCEDLEIECIYFTPSIFTGGELEVLKRQPDLSFVFAPSLDANVHRTSGRWKHLSPEAIDEINVELASLKHEWSAETDLGRLMTRALFLRLLVTLARSDSFFVAKPLGTLKSSDDIVANAIRIMESNFAEEVRIEEIASALCVCRDYFTRVFVNATGRTPREYLRYLRIERAKSLIISSSNSMTEIAEKSGFGDAAYFARAFRAHTGMSPRDFRRKYSRAV